MKNPPIRTLGELVDVVQDLIDSTGKHVYADDLQEALDRVPKQPILTTAEELRRALDELVTLQAHYAELLNMHDGGKRHAFKRADEWIERLRELAR